MTAYVEPSHKKVSAMIDEISECPVCKSVRELSNVLAELPDAVWEGDGPEFESVKTAWDGLTAFRGWHLPQAHPEWDAHVRVLAERELAARELSRS